MNRKALALLSGGLDSTLAAKLILDQDIELEAVNFLTIFCTSIKEDRCKYEAKRIADKFGIKLHIINVTEEYLDVVKNPKHGYGKNMNPCIDCRIFMFRKAKELMRKIGASFIITGEVLGERPMSQRRDTINTIERASGLEGLILRPLSAKFFQPTAAEKEGIVKRDLLLDIRGRSRRPQLALADKLGIEDYLTPAGGCLLADPGFSKRLIDIIEHNEFDLLNVELLKVGRHFRVDGGKIVIGRNKEDNERILGLARDGDVIVKMKDFPGPITLIRGDNTSLVEFAVSLTGGYTKGRDNEFILAEYRLVPDGKPQAVRVRPLRKEIVGIESI